MKKEKAVIGPAGVAAVVAAVDVPVFAIGGIEESNLAELTTLGIHRACVIRAVADAPDPDPLEIPPSAPPDERGFLQTAAEAASHNLRRQLGIAQRAVGALGGVAGHPSRAPAAAFELVETARSLTRQLAVVDPAHSPLWTGRSLGRRFEILSVSLDDVRRAAKGLGGTVNDLFVAAVAGGAGAYHRAKGAPVDELRMSMPVSIRDDRSAGGNAFSPTRVLVPAS